VLLTPWGGLPRGGDPPTQRQLAEQAGTDTMMTSQVVRKLAGRGLLERTDDPADARAKRLQVTAPGLELVAKALKDVEAADASFFDGVGDGFTESLAKLSP
jgi:DNA-binding MarR family transcriptional regulator